MSGEAVEELVAVLLCRRHLGATVIRPSQGDGGIDLLVPLPAGGVEIYQVKKFATNLTASQKRQISRSYNTLEAERRGQSLDVRAWHLTLPLNPTRQNLAWLKEVTTAAPYSCDWRGMNFLEGLAAEFPDVVDYYVSDGADRLARVVGQLSEALQLAPRADGAALVTPAQLIQHLQALQPLLDTDPHFIYGISLDPVPPLTPSDPGLILAVTSAPHGDAGPAITVKVFARFAEALRFRPIPLTLHFSAEPGSALESDLAAFEKFGTPFEAPTGTVTFDADLPGGLGGSFEGGSARIGPVLRGTTEPAYVLRLATVDDTGAVTSAVLIDMQPPSVGPSGRGIRTNGTDQDRVFDIEFLTDLADNHFTMHLTTRDFTGRYPSEVIGSIRFLLALKAPNRLAVAQPFGPITTTPVDLSNAPDWFDREALGHFLHILECLTAIQDYSSEQIVVPAAEAMTREARRAWFLARDLLEGNTLDLANYEVAVCLKAGVSPMEGQFAFAMVSDFSVSIGDLMVNLGKQITHCERAEVVAGSVSQHDDHLDCKIQAVDGSDMTIRLESSSLSGS